MAKSSFPSPVALYASGLTAMVESSIRAQDVFFQQMDALAERVKSKRNWGELRIPVPLVNTSHDADATRDMFHQFANMNLRNWELLAESLQTLPDWAQKAGSFPGEFLTDAFDKFRRDANGTMPGLAPTPPSPKAEPEVTAPKAAPVDTATLVAEAPVAPKSKKKKKAAPAPAPVVKLPPDDLTRIKGIGPKLAEKLNSLGVQNFSQIASWSRKDVDAMDEEIGGLGRIARDNWISQAQVLSGG